MTFAGKNNVVIAIVVLVFAIGISLLIAGVFMRKSAEKDCEENARKSAARVSNPALLSFIKKVQKTYYKMNPNKIIYMPDVTLANIQQEFSAYDARPEAIKKRTDAARTLYSEVTAMKFDEKRMLPRERKALAQVKHYLQSNFGSPYDENYYAGDWMMGPNYFCWQPICYIGNDLAAHFGNGTKQFQPKTVGDVEFVINSIKKHGQSATQYAKNMQYGVKAGMVRSVMDCASGLNSIKGRFPNVARGNESGIEIIIIIINYAFHINASRYIDTLHGQVVHRGWGVVWPNFKLRFFTGRAWYHCS